MQLPLLVVVCLGLNLSQQHNPPRLASSVPHLQRHRRVCLGSLPVEVYSDRSQQEEDSSERLRPPPRLASSDSQQPNPHLEQQERLPLVGCSDQAQHHPKLVEASLVNPQRHQLLQGCSANQLPPLLVVCLGHLNRLVVC